MKVEFRIVRNVEQTYYVVIDDLDLEKARDTALELIRGGAVRPVHTAESELETTATIPLIERT